MGLRGFLGEHALQSGEERARVLVHVHRVRQVRGRVGSNLSGIDYWPEGRPVVGPSDVRGRALGQRGPKGWCFCEDACTSFDVTSPSSPPHIVVVDPALLPADSRLRANCTTLD